MNNIVRDFYNKNPTWEWNRMFQDAYMQIVYMLHMDFIKENLKKGIKILDAGGGPGRYTADFLKQGYEVTLLDLSDKEIEFAKEKHAELGVRASDYICSDIREMSSIADEQFDLTICFGAPLCYCLEGRDKAMNELKRVTKPGGTVAVSVNAVWGILKYSINAQSTNFFANPEYWYINEVVETGNLPVHPEVRQPARHFFTVEDLKGLLESIGLEDIALGAAPCLCSANRPEVNEICKDEKAYKTLVDLELRSYKNPHLLGFGEFLMAKGRK